MVETKYDKINKRNELDKKLKKYSDDIVGLQDNWDGEGSNGFTKESWTHTTDLLRKIFGL